MLIAGFTGGFDPAHPAANDSEIRVRSLLRENGDTAFHDAAAVLLDDGEVVAAIELERINRIKHTSQPGATAVLACLEEYGRPLQDVDFFAFNMDEQLANETLDHLLRPRLPKGVLPDSLRHYVAGVFKRDLNFDVDLDKLRFVPHHQAHALSAFAVSGFEDALVVTLDGQGDGSSGSVSVAEAGTLRQLATFSEQNSIGNYYTTMISQLSYGLFDEYKVMGLAPYGNPERFESDFTTTYSLIDGGFVQINHAAIAAMKARLPRRQRGEAFDDDHKDFAAALQSAVERMIFHVMHFFAQQTGQTNLCYAGGVAQNSTFNGKLRHSGIFEHIFIQPASYDAGGALGAAIAVALEQSQGKARFHKMEHVFLGRDIGTPAVIEASVQQWDELVDIRYYPDIARQAAARMAKGEVIGWVQGRAEFGPRSLGARCILADPRPAKHKEIVNFMVKKRESYRPFAPSVLAEKAHLYFEMQEGQKLPFMTEVVRVREAFAALLGAVTHVDRSARVQTVDRADNPRYWQLISEFEQITGLPVLLNTSFNNHAEPIVDGVDDAVTCFLTTGINALIIGDALIEKKSCLAERLLAARKVSFTIPKHVVLHSTNQANAGGVRYTQFSILNTITQRSVSVSSALYGHLVGSHKPAATAPLKEAAAQGPSALASEAWELWSERFIAVAPVAAQMTHQGCAGVVQQRDDLGAGRPPNTN